MASTSAAASATSVARPGPGWARLNYNGQLDTGFVPPSFSGSVRALAVQDDGKLLVAGSIGITGQIPALRLYRLNEDGSLDNGFQAAGLASGVRTVQALQIEDDGRILVAGEVDGRWLCPASEHRRQPGRGLRAAQP